MELKRVVPDRLFAMSAGRTPRIVGYRAAAWLYGLDGVPNFQPEFAIPHGSWRRNGGVDHQRRRIEDLEIESHRELLVTSVRQTLADLCAVVDLDVVERAVESALRMGLVDDLSLRDFAYLFAFSRHGTPGLLEVLGRRPHDAPPTGSDLETLCLQVWRRGGVPTPQRQHPVFDHDGQLVATADFGFPPIPFVAETDGLATHGSGPALQYDLNRQNRINDAGYDLRRFTHADVTLRPGYVCRETMTGLLIAAARRAPKFVLR